jgi:hypothetical protein
LRELAGSVEVIEECGGRERSGAGGWSARRDGFQGGGAELAQDVEGAAREFACAWKQIKRELLLSSFGAILYGIVPDGRGPGYIKPGARPFRGRSCVSAAMGHGTYPGRSHCSVSRNAALLLAPLGDRRNGSEIEKRGPVVARSLLT